MLSPAMTDPLIPPDPDPGPGTGRRSPTSGGASGWTAVAALVLLLAGIIGVGLAGGSAAGPTTATSCSAARTEPLDPNSVVRVLPNGRELEYLNDPPSSGAFAVGPNVAPVSTSTLTRPVQVGLLARGMVLIQYLPGSLSAEDLATLQGLPGDSVVVAPNPDLKPPIVATAWRVRQECTALDVTALTKFAALNANRAPADLNSATTVTTAG
jgi:hypothetical protein